MLKTNLASRPFYNERAVNLLLVALAIVAVALTAFNAQQLELLSRERSTLRAKIASDAAAGDRARRQVATLQQTVDRTALNGLARATREANLLISERTFSWTIFFTLIEKTLPADVRLLAVAPQIENGEMLVTIQVVAKRPDDLSAFVEALVATGAFSDVQPREEDRMDDGMQRVTVRARYLQPNVPVPPPVIKAKGGRP
jgi:hypothetical protein